MDQGFYETWALKKQEEENREEILKWKAVNLANLLLRNSGKLTIHSACEVGGAEGLVLHQVSGIMNISSCTNYEISQTFCKTGKRRFPRIRFINKPFHQSPEEYDLVILSDITEHVDNDHVFLEKISKHVRYLAIKVPIEKSLFSSRFYQILRGKKIPAHMKYGKNHINGHLRGYTIAQAKRYISRYYRIMDYEISDVAFFHPSPKKYILKRVFGKFIFVRLYGGAFFAIGKNKDL